jgi:hypothetical protein
MSGSGTAVRARARQQTTSGGPAGIEITTSAKQVEALAFTSRTRRAGSQQYKWIDGAQSPRLPWTSGRAGRRNRRAPRPISLYVRVAPRHHSEQAWAFVLLVPQTLGVVQGRAVDAAVRS